VTDRHARQGGKMDCFAALAMAATLFEIRIGIL
jgi:hypothetical protein